MSKDRLAINLQQPAHLPQVNYIFFILNVHNTVRVTIAISSYVNRREKLQNSTQKTITEVRYSLINELVMIMN